MLKANTLARDDNKNNYKKMYNHKDDDDAYRCCETTRWQDLAGLDCPPPAEKSRLDSPPPAEKSRSQCGWICVMCQRSALNCFKIY